MKLPIRKNRKPHANPAATAETNAGNKPLLPSQTDAKGRDGTRDTAQALDNVTRAMPTRRIDATCIAEMAKLVAKMLTESEACRRLGIKPRTWFDWKSRAGRTQKFSDLLEAYRANRIESLINRIENSANGIDVKYPDFRAALALLKITDQKRFGDSPPVQGAPPAVVSVNIMHDTLKRLFAPAITVEAITLPSVAPALPLGSALGTGQEQSDAAKSVSGSPVRLPVTRKKK